MEGIIRHFASVQWGVRLHQLIPFLNASLVILLAYVSAGISWRVWVAMNENVEESYLPAPSVIAVTSPHQSSASLDAVAALHLFGNVEESRVALPEKTEIDAPETRLSLTLKGIIAVSDGGQGLALIAEGSSQEKLYRVGDALTGGVVLHEVLAEKVILKRGGRFETLTLPRELVNMSGASKKQPSRTTGTRTRGERVSAISQQLRTIRDKIAENPVEAMSEANQMVQATPVMEGGAIKGYQVRPGKQRRLFNGTGLRSGDVVTSINGIALSDTSQMATLFSQFKTADKFNITVERGGREQQLTIDLNK